MRLWRKEFKIIEVNCTIFQGWYDLDRLNSHVGCGWKIVGSNSVGEHGQKILFILCRRKWFWQEAVEIERIHTTSEEHAA